MWMLWSFLGLAGVGIGYLQIQNESQWKEENDRYLRYLRKQHNFTASSMLRFGKRSYLAFDDEHQQMLAVGPDGRNLYAYENVTAVRARQPNPQLTTVEVEIDVSDTGTPMLSFKTTDHKASYIVAKLKAHIKQLVNLA